MLNLPFFHSISPTVFPHEVKRGVCHISVYACMRAKKSNDQYFAINNRLCVGEVKSIHAGVDPRQGSGEELRRGYPN